MKILLINDFSNMGGAEKVVHETQKLLEKYGHEVIILYGHDKENVDSYISRWFSIKYYNVTKNIIKKFNPDVIHIHGFTRVLSPSPIVCAKKLNKPVVLTIHDPILYCPKLWAISPDGEICTEGYNISCVFRNCHANTMGCKYIPYNFLKWLKVGIHRHYIRKYVNYYICPSTQLKELTQKSLNIPISKIAYLPNFVTINNNGNCNKFNAINPKEFIYVGRISKEKGIDIAIKAIHYLISKKGLNDIIFKIIGNGPELNNLKLLVKSLGISSNIHFLGKIPNDMLNIYYQESVAVLMPSIWLENCPIVALEAMANKKPIIASNIGGYKDMIIHNKSGYLFRIRDYKDMAKYIEILYNNKELSTKFGEMSFKILKNNFNEYIYYNELINIYNKLLL